jgi:hypothetical protein
VRTQEGEEVAPCVEGDHFEDVGEVLALGGELDHLPLAEVADLDALEERPAFGETLPGRTQSSIDGARYGG